MNPENPFAVSIPQQATDGKNWRLALFSEPTTPENFPIKLFEAFAVGFGGVQIPLLALFTLVAVFVTLLMSFFGLIAGMILDVLLFIVMSGGLLVVLNISLLSVTIGFIYRKKAALVGMIIYTVVMPMISYFALSPPIMEAINYDAVRSYYVHVFLFGLSLQYVLPIIVGLVAFRWFGYTISRQ